MTNFASNITELRKKKGINQKNAAKDLGISQALLSHYENGIRECGLDFVVKVANYYQVSCDFLLGNSNSPISLDSMEKLRDIPEDSNFNEDTLFRACSVIASKFAKSKVNTETSNKIYAIRNYMLLAKGVEKGLVPQSWLGDNNPSQVQLHFLDSLSITYISQLKKNSRSPKADTPPECISTVNNYVYNLLNENLAELIV